MTSKFRTHALAAALATAVAASLGTAGAASAGTYCVAQPACSGTSVPDLQDALIAAAVDPGPDRVEVGPGLFHADAGFSYTPVGAGNTLELVGAGRDKTELRGDSQVNHRPALVLAGAAPAHVSDLTIKSSNPADPLFVTGGLRLFGLAERIDVNGGTRSDGVELLKDSTLKASRISIASRFHGVLSTDGNATVAESSIDAPYDGTAAAASGSGALTVSHSKLNAARGVQALSGGAIKIDNSVVLANETGLFAYDVGGPPTSIDATNVTVVGTDPTVEGARASSVNAPNTTQVTVENSVIAQVTHSLGRSSITGGTASLTARHSAYDQATVREFGPGGVDQAPGNLDLTNPGFVDLASGDYRLAGDSPLRDTGDAAPAGGLAATDLAGTMRSVDGNGDGVAAPDIGAFEFQPPAATLPATPSSTPTGAPTDLAPVITAASLSHRRFSIARKHGTDFRLTLSKKAGVKIAIRRGRGLAGTLMRACHLGANRIAFSGRIGHRALRPGRYVATVTATDASGKRSIARTLRFTVVSR
jgi:hypothetical protein